MIKLDHALWSGELNVAAFINGYLMTTRWGWGGVGVLSDPSVEEIKRTFWGFSPDKQKKSPVGADRGVRPPTHSTRRGSRGA